MLVAKSSMQLLHLVVRIAHQVFNLMELIGRKLSS